MSEMMINQTIENTENIDQKALELAQDFSYDGYQVVRRELFAHLREPAVVIRRDSVTFNTACIAGLEDAVYIQILVNQDNKRMVVRKCEENDKDALRWCIEKPDKRKSRKMSNKLFSAMMYDMMRFELERGKIDEFADLLNYHWELSRKVDAGSTNTLIDQIFLSIEDLIDAKMVCGAGGGGFLQVILKKGVQKADVHKRLKDVFQDNPVDVWDCEII